MTDNSTNDAAVKKTGSFIVGGIVCVISLLLYLSNIQTPKASFGEWFRHQFAVEDVGFLLPPWVLFWIMFGRLIFLVRYCAGWGVLLAYHTLVYGESAFDDFGFIIVHQLIIIPIGLGLYWILTQSRLTLMSGKPQLLYTEIAANQFSMMSLVQLTAVVAITFAVISYLNISFKIEHVKFYFRNFCWSSYLILLCDIVPQIGGLLRHQSIILAICLLPLPIISCYLTFVTNQLVLPNVYYAIYLYMLNFVIALTIRTPGYHFSWTKNFEARAEIT